jgi:hypothetical protein
MSLLHSVFNKNEYQCLSSSREKREQYGEIFTPYALIKRMFDMLSSEDFEDPCAKWLDPGAGTGFFSIFLFWKLDAGLVEKIPEKAERRRHILTNMIYMVELQEDNVTVLTSLFGNNANIVCADYLSDETFGAIEFDYVVGNPPYNKNGIKKVPTNNIKNKKNDGATLWFDFIIKSVALLKKGGSLLMIVPSLWMKPDKMGAYDYITQHKLRRIECLSNTKTNRVFGGMAQTPTCFFLMAKQPSDGVCDIYDTDMGHYVSYAIRDQYPIPVFAVSVVNKFISTVDNIGSIVVIKTNMPAKRVNLSVVKYGKYKYDNIKTARLDGVSPSLDVNYSDAPLSFHGVVKLVLPHKMYGFPFLDLIGKYGISNRDNYVIVGRTEDDLCIIGEFLSTKTALYIYEATRYRMKYLEKYAFLLLPDVTKIPELIETRPITDATIAKYFKLSAKDISCIEGLHTKNYNFNYKGD